MKELIGKRIRKIRESKDFSQENVASELDITTSAYAKIERGATDPSSTRLLQIAKILEVDVAVFFQDIKPISNKVSDPEKQYGFATKSDIEELTNMITQLQKEIEKLKSEKVTPKKISAKKVKR